MEMIFAKHIRTTTSNVSERIEWRNFKSEEEAREWEAKIKKDDNTWNYDTPWANSMRSSDVYVYTPESLSELTLGSLEDMPLSMFLKAQGLIKTLP